MSFKVGDRVRIIDPRGDQTREAMGHVVKGAEGTVVKGAEGTVTRVGSELLRVKLDSGYETSMFAERFELIPTSKFKVGDRVRCTNYNVLYSVVEGKEYTVTEVAGFYNASRSTSPNAKTGGGITVDIAYPNDSFYYPTSNFELVDAHPFKVGDKVKLRAKTGDRYPSGAESWGGPQPGDIYTVTSTRATSSHNKKPHGIQLREIDLSYAYPACDFELASPKFKAGDIVKLNQAGLDRGWNPSTEGFHRRGEPVVVQSVTEEGKLEINHFPYYPPEHFELVAPQDPKVGDRVQLTLNVSAVSATHVTLRPEDKYMGSVTMPKERVRVLPPKKQKTYRALLVGQSVTYKGKSAKVELITEDKKFAVLQLGSGQRTLVHVNDPRVK